MNYSYPRLNSARGSETLWKSVRNTGPDYNSAHRTTRAENTETRDSRIKAKAQGGVISI